MKKILQKLLAIVFITTAAFNVLQAQTYTATSDSLPPVGGTYKDPGIFCKFLDDTGSGTTADAIECINYTITAPPPPSVPGAFVIINTGCTVNLNYSNGGPPTPVTAPAAITMKITYNHTTGTTRYFDTEMLQLNISGGTLPPGVQFRESPTLQSIGDCHIESNGGYFLITSFFDVFTELSFDGGATWHPSIVPPSHLVLQSNAPNSIPTLSQWGLIALSVLLLSVGMFFVKRRIV